MMFRNITTDEASEILHSSEGKPTTFRPPMKGAERVQAVGHTAVKHFALSNSDLTARYWEELRRDNSKDFLVITAFTGEQKDEIACAAAAVMNAKQTQAALGTLFGSQGGEGMRAKVSYFGSKDYRMRYVASSGYAVQVMPTSSFVMVLDRHKDRPFGIHVHTFYGAVPYVPRNYATILDRSGKPLLSHLG